MSYLSRKPRQIDANTWYYEEERGLHVVHEARREGAYLLTDSFIIPWSMVRLSLSLKDRDKSTTKSTKGKRKGNTKRVK